MPQVPNELSYYTSLLELAVSLDEDYSPNKARFEASLPFALQVGSCIACVWSFAGCGRSLRFWEVLVVCRARRSKSISSSTPNLLAFLRNTGSTSSAGSGGMETRLIPSGCSTDRCCKCMCADAAVPDEHTVILAHEP